MGLEGGFLEAVVSGLGGLCVNVFSKIADADNIQKPLEQLIFDVTRKYVKNYSDRHGQLQVLGMSKPVSLDAIYSGVRMLALFKSGRNWVTLA